MMRRARWVVIGLLGLALLAAVGVWRGRRLATLRAREARREAVALATCLLGERPALPEAWEATLRRRLELQAPGEAPLSPCAPAASRLGTSLRTLSSTPFRRSADEATLLLPTVQQLEEFPLDAPALDLHRRVASLASALRTAIPAACGLARLEDPGPPCLPAPAPPPPLPVSVVLDAPGSEPHVAWVATASERAISVRIACGSEAWESRSTDRGAHFTPLRLPGDGTVLEDAPQLLAEDEHERALLRLTHQNAGAWSRLVQVAGGEARELGAVPGFEAAGSAPPLGVRAVRQGSAWAAVGRDAAGRGLLVEAPTRREGKSTARALPEGELLGAFPNGRLLLQRRAPSGFASLTSLSVPAPGAAWERGVEAIVAYVPPLTPWPDVARECGLPGERYATWVGTVGDESALVAVSEREVHAYRFHTTKDARYRVLCGSCPPMALELRPDGLGLFVPVRRALTPARIQAPLIFERGRSERSAQGACTPSSLAVVYEADGKILVQQREAGGWRFETARVLAEDDGRGRPTEPAIVGVGDALVVLWRRERAGRVVIEAHRLDEPREKGGAR